MAIRKIRQFGETCLRKNCREVTELTPRLHQLIYDMFDTMYEAMGVGLAAPQVGILKRIVVIDVGDDPIAMINPRIVETSGEQTGMEGCLSLTGKQGQVTRPNIVTVEFLDENMELQRRTGEGLLARAMMHETEHLDGILYTDKVEGNVEDVIYDEDEEE